MGKLSTRIPREHNKYHGYTVRGTPHGPLIIFLELFFQAFSVATYRFQAFDLHCELEYMVKTEGVRFG